MTRVLAKYAFWGAVVVACTAAGCGSEDGSTPGITTGDGAPDGPRGETGPADAPPQDRAEASAPRPPDAVTTDAESRQEDADDDRSLPWEDAADAPSPDEPPDTDDHDTIADSSPVDTPTEPDAADEPPVDPKDGPPQEGSIDGGDGDSSLDATADGSVPSDADTSEGNLDAALEADALTESGADRGVLDVVNDVPSADSATDAPASDSKNPKPPEEWLTLAPDTDCRTEYKSRCFGSADGECFIVGSLAGFYCNQPVTLTLNLYFPVSGLHAGKYEPVRVFPGEDLTMAEGKVSVALIHETESPYRSRTFYSDDPGKTVTVTPGPDGGYSYDFTNLRMVQEDYPETVTIGAHGFCAGDSALVRVPIPR